MFEEIRAGWAIRRWRPISQECPSGEFGDKTWGDWFACCPRDTSANRTGDNTQCDDGKMMGDSTPKAQCANSTWTLWYHNGYFCCDSDGDDRGYFYYSDDDVGCANNSWITNASSDVWRAGSRPNPPASSSKASSINKGAIVGGVVGGISGALIIAGIVWFFCRRRRSKAPKIDEASTMTSNSPSLQRDACQVEISIELEGSNLEPLEIDGSRERKEMPSSMQLLRDIPPSRPPSELP